MRMTKNAPHNWFIPLSEISQEKSLVNEQSPQELESSSFEM